MYFVGRGWFCASVFVWLDFFSVGRGGKNSSAHALKLLGERPPQHGEEHTLQHVDQQPRRETAAEQTRQPLFPQHLLRGVEVPDAAVGVRLPDRLHNTHAVRNNVGGGRCKHADGAVADVPPRSVPALLRPQRVERVERVEPREGACPRRDEVRLPPRKQLHAAPLSDLLHQERVRRVAVHLQRRLQRVDRRRENPEESTQDRTQPRRHCGARAGTHEVGAKQHGRRLHESVAEPGDRRLDDRKSEPFVKARNTTLSVQFAQARAQRAAVCVLVVHRRPQRHEQHHLHQPGRAPREPTLRRLHQCLRHRLRLRGARPGSQAWRVGGGAPD
eukprot:Rhum_TRINITY_DN14458_c0_g1::Rhum_TRINITY_DN14458_c0_g1_i1::g.89377::m.89377